MKSQPVASIDELKYPIGQFKRPTSYSPKILNGYISVIGEFPEKLRNEVSKLGDEQLDTAYRPNGWSIRQVVHHCADSHMNALVRLKLALTEENPTIKPYMEARWAELEDGKASAIEPALQTLQGVHKRWVILLKSLVSSEWKRGFVHPEKGRRLGLEENTGMYAWHCDHHLAHITGLKKRMSWK